MLKGIFSKKVIVINPDVEIVVKRENIKLIGAHYISKYQDQQNRINARRNKTQQATDIEWMTNLKKVEGGMTGKEKMVKRGWKDRRCL